MELSKGQLERAHQNLVHNAQTLVRQTASGAGYARNSAADLYYILKAKEEVERLLGKTKTAPRAAKSE